MVRTPEAKERKKERALAYYYANKEKRAGVMNDAAKAWYHANRELVNQRRRSAEGRQKINEYKKTEACKIATRARGSQPRNRVIHSQRNRLRQFIKQTGCRVHLRFGCSPDFMRAHIEKQFTKGMTWENYGAWHIDHIMPCAQFDLSNQMHADICFNWQNLRPLWADENHAKSDTITHPQLCLPIAA